MPCHVRGRGQIARNIIYVRRWCHRTLLGVDTFFVVCHRGLRSSDLQHFSVGAPAGWRVSERKFHCFARQFLA